MGTTKPNNNIFIKVIPLVLFQNTFYDSLEKTHILFYDKKNFILFKFTDI